MIRQPLVAGNWKMNGDLASITGLINDTRQALDDQPGLSTDVLVFPPHVYISTVVQGFKGSRVGVGAQDVDHRESGAVTGAVSAGMLNDIGCSHVLVGHSERRTLFGETDDLVAEKFNRVLQAGLVPIVCVGETLDERQRGSTLDVVTRQLDVVLDAAGIDAFNQAMVAYEPVWAIGTGESATPEQAEEVHACLRDCLARRDTGIGENCRVLYGGSVTPDNASALFAQENLDGALVGGASLNGNSFARICEAAGTQS